MKKSAVLVVLMCGVALVAGQPFDSLALSLPKGELAQDRQATGAFTAAQATAGRIAYQANCASCHLADLAGRGEAPPLAGPSFVNAWRTRTTKDLIEYMQATMPPNAATLPPEQYLAIASFILQSNGASAGAQPLTASTAVAIGSVATGAVAANAA